MKTAKEAMAAAVGGSKIIGDDAIQNLWGMGYTIVRRQSDHLYVDERIIPRGMAYQWCATKAIDGARSTAHFYGATGWSPVSASRHDGIFAPAGYQGDIEFGGLILMEKPKAEVDAELAANAAKAHKQVGDWAKRNAADGFSGTVRVQDQTAEAIGEEKTIVIDCDAGPRDMPIPRELTPYILEILKERDVQLKHHRPTSDPSTPMREVYSEEAKARANALQRAIKTIRDRHKEELNAAQSDAQG